jgi:hypothetical protein
MSIRPVEFSGMVQRTHDVSTIKQNEDNKPAFNQHAIHDNLKREVAHSLQHVKKGEDAQKKDKKFDAKDKGSNEYQDKQNKKQNKEKREQGKVINKMAHNSFDIKV